jgi:type I restriction enzyme R subunit
MSKFTGAKLEAAIIELLEFEGYEYVCGDAIPRAGNEVLLKDDLRTYLSKRHASDYITSREIDSIIIKLEVVSASELLSGGEIAITGNLPRPIKSNAECCICSLPAIPQY